jgi:hypothetical protein
MVLVTEECSVVTTSITYNRMFLVIVNASHSLLWTTRLLSMLSYGLAQHDIWYCRMEQRCVVRTFSCGQRWEALELHHVVSLCPVISHMYV